MEQNIKQNRINELYQLLAQISDPEDIRLLLDDLCTRKEVENMAERVFAARLLIHRNGERQWREGVGQGEKRRDSSRQCRRSLSCRSGPAASDACARPAEPHRQFDARFRRRNDDGGW